MCEADGCARALSVLVLPVPLQVMAGTIPDWPRAQGSLRAECVGDTATPATAPVPHPWPDAHSVSGWTCFLWGCVIAVGVAGPVPS